MSARISPDGMYYWDGQSWVTTLSHDGRHRWNGMEWIPATGAPYAAFGYQPQGETRVPTSWTRSLQYAVAAWYAWSILYTLAMPFWMGGMMSEMFNRSLQNQESLNPNAVPPPPGFTEMMSTFMTFGLWITVVIYAAIFAVAIIGALQAWTWVYYVVLVLLGLSAILLPVDLVYVFVGARIASIAGMTMPSWLYLVSFLTGIPGAALFVWMLIALVKRGPWAMRRMS